MNSFSNMEINDMLDNRFRLEEKHTPNYLAECFQRLFPTLGRMGLSTVVDEMARTNSRCFGATDGDMPSGAGMRHCEANSSRLPVRGETLSLGFFFELWKREFRFEGYHSDKFIFTDELRLAFKINPREFWEVLIRADRDLGNYLKNSVELLKYRELPREISLNLRLYGTSTDDKTVRLLKEKLPFSRDNFTTHEIAKVCLQIFEVANPMDYDVRRLAEELEKENGIRRLNGEFTAIIPKKALDRLSTKCVLEFFKNKPLASAEASAKVEGIELKQIDLSQPQALGFSLPEAQFMPVQVRGDYRGHGDPVEPAPAYPAIGAKFGNLFNISQSGSDFIKKHENLVLYVYGDKDNSWPRKRITIDNYSSIKGYPTIGYGYKIINKVELESYLRNGITEAQAIALFEKTLPAYVDDVKRNTKNFILTQHQFDALVSFVYNAGLPAVMRSEVYKGLLEGDIKKAAEGFLLEIPKYDGSVNKGLAERRRAESEMFLQH